MTPSSATPRDYQESAGEPGTGCAAAGGARPDDLSLGRPVGGLKQDRLRLLENAARYGITSRDSIHRIVQLAGSSDHVIRRASIPALAQITGPEGYTTLISLLSDRNATIQGEAAETLGNIGASEAVEPLKDLLRHKEPLVALRAALALGRLKDKSGLAVAKRSLKRDDPHARLAAYTLGIIVGHRFRPTDEGVAAARRYLKKKQ